MTSRNIRSNIRMASLAGIVMLMSFFVKVDSASASLKTSLDEQPVMTISRANVIWESSFGFMKFDGISDLSNYGYFECNGAVTADDLTGAFPLFDIVYTAIYDGEIITHAGFTTDTDVQCMIEPEYTTYTTLNAVITLNPDARTIDNDLEYLSSIGAEYHTEDTYIIVTVSTSPYTAAHIGSLSSVTDLYTYIPQVVYLPLAAN